MAEKIDLKKIDREAGMATDDLLRDGVAPAHDRLKVAAVIKALVDTVNTLVDEVTALKQGR